ncbi:hypothetical protein LPJ56_002064 [Coemansia sp. RSA 2599]|nr:hypothetical protein LPJ56_002064 [Coemansia sp. RSA 2599]
MDEASDRNCQQREERSISIDSIGFDSISSYGNSKAGSDESHTTIATPSQTNAASRKRSRSDTAHIGNNASSSDSGGCTMESCIETMVNKREQLRRRFKDWASAVDDSATRLRCITDNALVNQSTCLEQMLADGKATIDKIVGEQSRIHSQLSSFVSLLASAQEKSFAGGNDDRCGAEKNGKDVPKSEESMLSRSDPAEPTANMDSIVIDD